MSNKNRSYSLHLLFTLLALSLGLVSGGPAPAGFDVDGDGQEGLVEAIHALQVVAGVATAAPVSCTAPDEVESAGQCWKDRNLGASQRALSPYIPERVYGDLYQWGRPGDGHQNRSSSPTPVISANDVPGHGDFITVSPSPYDWRSPQNNNLWQGIGGVNNPCPQGFRLPTEAEWEIERVSWGTGNQNSAGAFDSPLKLVAAGYRTHSNGTVLNAGSNGYYWSSTVGGSYSRYLNFYSGYASVNGDDRAFGFSVRCLKD